MDVKQIIKEYLEKNGYTGLFHEDRECGCSIDDLFPCDNYFGECVSGHRTNCNECKTKENCELDQDEINGFCIRA